MENSLVVTELTKTFETAAEPLHIIRSLDLSLADGEAISIMGPSGSGKSTLLHMLGTLDEPTSGSILLNHQDPWQLPSSKLAGFRNSNIGFIFQDHHLLPQCTVLENVLVPLLPSSGADQDGIERAELLLERVGLSGRLTHRPGQISGGERQRVAVCRALINQPALMLADEPTGNLDRNTAESVGSVLLELCKEQDAILICVTHSSELSDRFATQYELVDGTLSKK